MQIRPSLLAWLLVSLSIEPCSAQLPAGKPLQQRSLDNLISIDASARVAPVETGFLHLGGISSTGHSLQVNNRYLTLDGKPWLPVMGEMHYTRVPEEEWEAEILKMKAAGVNIISTYVFWIHHEEVEGQFDWSGRRNLRRFVELCGKHGMYVYLRPGPWAHGEARNGGFPDWLNRQKNLRTNDPEYLRYVSRFFDHIGEQLKGLMWRDGGPVIGTQLENEYPLHGPGRGAEHILRLKQLAIEAGIDPPLFSVTGWPSLDFPAHEVLPVSGGYPDGFWYGSRTALPPSMNYLFNFNRELGDMGATVPSTDPSGKVDLAHDPYFDAEQAGGMATSYHRRPVLSADDIAALTLVGLGSGVNLYGYYMFHGGTNPAGKLTTLQESQATGYPNDLPQIDYDFQAPIGAFGEMRESYRKTRLLHLFLNAYGSQLATMPAVGPAEPRERSIEAAAADTSHARVAVRTDGRSGFVFVNNYVRQLAMPARAGFQVDLRLQSSELRIPMHPIDIPSGAYFLWPFHLLLGDAVLEYSTAQPLTRIETAQGGVRVFFAIDGIAPEFSFEAATIRPIEAPGARVTRAGGAWLVDRIKAGRNATIRVTDMRGVTTTILLLTQEEAEHCAILQAGAQEILSLTQSGIFQDFGQVHLRSTASPMQEVLLFPAANFTVQEASGASGLSVPSSREGLWTRYVVSQPGQHFALSVTPIQAAQARRAMAMGPPVAWRHGPVPTTPDEGAFKGAAEWRLAVTSSQTEASVTHRSQSGVERLSGLFLRMRFTGDIAHLEDGKRLLDDNFYNGKAWQVDLKCLTGTMLPAPLTLSILPMPKSAPIYMDDSAWRLLRQHPGAALLGASVVPEYESVLTLRPRPGTP